MQTGDVIFIKSDTWIAKLVRYFDPGKFSHVAIAVSETRILEAQYNTRSRVVPLTYDSYEVFSMHLTEAQKRHLLKIVPKYKGKFYDFLHALSMATGWARLDNPKYLICTELDMDILKEVGVLNPYLRDMRPNELYKYLSDGHR